MFFTNAKENCCSKISEVLKPEINAIQNLIKQYEVTLNKRLRTANRNVNYLNQNEEIQQFIPVDNKIHSESIMTEFKQYQAQKREEVKIAKITQPLSQAKSYTSFNLRELMHNLSIAYQDSDRISRTSSIYFSKLDEIIQVKYEHFIIRYNTLDKIINVSQVDKFFASNLFTGTDLKLDRNWYISNNMMKEKIKKQLYELNQILEEEIQYASEKAQYNRSHVYSNGIFHNKY